MITVDLPPAAAIRRYPELVELLGGGDPEWSFHHFYDDHGELVRIHGYRRWPGGWIDALCIHARSAARSAGPAEAFALRTGRHNRYGVVWQHDGPLTELIAALRGLPRPDEPMAPRAVLARCPDWIPEH